MLTSGKFFNVLIFLPSGVSQLKAASKDGHELAVAHVTGAQKSCSKARQTAPQAHTTFMESEPFPAWIVSAVAGD